MLYTNVLLKLLTQTPCTVVNLASREVQMIKASAKATRAANHCPGDASSTPARVNLSFWTCLLMVWLLPAGQGGFTVHRACLGHMYWLSSTSTALVTAASREKGLWVERCSSGE